MEFVVGGKAGGVSYLADANSFGGEISMAESADSSGCKSWKTMFCPDGF